MSRIAKEPVLVPAGLEVKLEGQVLSIKSKLGEMTLNIHEKVRVAYADNKLTVAVADDSKEANMQSGTTRALVHNMVVGLDKGFVKKLNLVGVGYRAQAKGKTLSLNLGYSHPIEHALPEGVTCETPSQTEIVLKSYDKSLLGQTAADIRAYRAPEPYKGKGIRYSDEVVQIKEAKKK